MPSAPFGTFLVTMSTKLPILTNINDTWWNSKNGKFDIDIFFKHIYTIGSIGQMPSCNEPVSNGIGKHRPAARILFGVRNFRIVDLSTIF